MAFQKPSMVRVRLQVLRDFHSPVLRAGEDRLRAAMVEYAQLLAGRERDSAFSGVYSAAVR